MALCQARISTKPLWRFSSSNPYHSQSRAEQVLIREYWAIYRGLAFLGRIIQLLAHPLLSISKLSLFLSLPLRRRSSLVTGDGGGDGVADVPNYTTAGKPVPL